MESRGKNGGEIVQLHCEKMGRKIFLASWFDHAVGWKEYIISGLCINRS